MVALLLAVGLLICGGCKTITIPDWIGGATNDVSQGTANGGSSTVTNSTTGTTAPVATSDYKITRVTASDIYWTGPDLTWDERSVRDMADPEDAAMIARAGGPCCGESHLYRADGQGGKFDHVRRNSKQRDWKNVHGGYGAFRTLGEPADGEACELWLVSYDGKQRVKVGDFKWVR
jgi:hypothetical protein